MLNEKHLLILKKVMHEWGKDNSNKKLSSATQEVSRKQPFHCLSIQRSVVHIAYQITKQELEKDGIGHFMEPLLLLLYVLPLHSLQFTATSILYLLCTTSTRK